MDYATFESKRQTLFQKRKRDFDHDVAGLMLGATGKDIRPRQQAVARRQLQFNRQRDEDAAEMNQIFGDHVRMGPQPSAADPANAAPEPMAMHAPRPEFDPVPTPRGGRAGGAQFGPQLQFDPGPFAQLSRMRVPDGAVAEVDGRRVQKSAAGWSDYSGEPAAARSAPMPVRPVQPAQTAAVPSQEDMLRRRVAAGLPVTAEEGASVTPTGGMQVADGQVVTGRDGKRYRKTPVGFISADALQFDAPARPDPNAEAFQRTQDYNAQVTRQGEEWRRKQAAEANAKLDRSFSSAGFGYDRRGMLRTFYDPGDRARLRRTMTMDYV